MNTYIRVNQQAYLAVGSMLCYVKLCYGQYVSRLLGLDLVGRLYSFGETLKFAFVIYHTERFK